MIIKCKMCGGDLRPADNATTCECEYCGSVQTLPKLDNERRLNLYDRANHFRRSNEYDKAMAIFEQVLQEDRTDAEAYWSLVLCRYGIEYVEDPISKKRIPTVNRVQFTSILVDEDYKSAMEYAYSEQKAIYEQEAKAIDAIQKGILDISKKEKPFDVFICYKETDSEGKRTPDSVLANDLYHQLTQEGFKVFFSRITLEDKLGQEYEPYIFAALNSAKVMVVLGTKPEYFKAVWVKNEWSRYLALIKAGQNKTLVPAYKGMDPYDLPEEFSHLQAQDMNKLGFMQDLIRGIKKLAGEEKPAVVQPQVVQQVEGGANVASLIGRAFIALEDGEWAKADDFCEQALNQDFKNARAYLGKLMAELKIHKESDLSNQQNPIEQGSNYVKALRFADEKLKAQLTGANDTIKNRNEQNQLKAQYQKAMSALNTAKTVADILKIKDQVAKLTRYEGAAKGLQVCDDKIEAIQSSAYDKANQLMQQEQYAAAAKAFRAVGDYRDCLTVAVKCEELEAQRLAKIAAEQAERERIAAERRAKEEAERKEKERIAAEQKAREAEIKCREAEAKAAKAKRTTAVLAFIAVLCVAAFFVVTKVVLPKMNYDKAVVALQDGRYDEAIAAFVELGDYEDCDYRIVQVMADKAFADGKYDAVSEYYARLPWDYQDHADDLTTMYNAAVKQMDAGSYDDAVAAFTQLGNYSDSKKQIDEANYRKACGLMNAGSREEAAAIFTSLDNYRDSKHLIGQMTADMLFEAGSYADAWTAYAALPEAYHTHAAEYAAMYEEAAATLSSGDYDNAYEQFIALGNYSDANAKAAQCGTDKADSLFTAGYYQAAAEVYSAIGNADKANESVYKYAAQLASQGEYLQAANAYWSVQAYADSQEQHYQMGLQARVNGKLADALTILSADPNYRDTKEAIYQTGVSASSQKLYEVSVSAFTQIGAYKDAAMKLTMDTYAWGGQLYDNEEYDKSAEVFTSMGSFSDAPTRAKEAAYAAATAVLNSKQYDDAMNRFEALGSYQDSAEQYKAAKYAKAAALLESEAYEAAATLFMQLGSYSNSADQVKECAYRPAKAEYAAGQYEAALNAFTKSELSSYCDSATIMDDCRYQLGKAAMEKSEYAAARDWFDTAGSYSDSATQASECRYQLALAQMNAGAYDKAIAAFAEIEAYSDSTAQIAACYNAKAAALETQGSYEAAYVQYELAGNAAKMQECAYQVALTKVATSEYEPAIAWFEKVGDYSDAKEQILTIGEYYYATQQYDLAEAVYVKVVGTGVAAQRLYELGQYYELVGDSARAAQAYGEAGDYEDAKAKHKIQQYQTAEALFKAQDWKAARAAYAAIPGYQDADSKIVACDNEIAAARDAAFQPGNYVTFGSYAQTASKKDDTAIEWLVLERDGNKALLISRYVLEIKQYNETDTDVTWETCSLRNWLNSTFVSKAFTATEQAGIVMTTVDNTKTQGHPNVKTSGGSNTQDLVFLLSYAEAGKYFNASTDGANAKARVAATDAVDADYSINTTYTSDEGKAAWPWNLRSPGNEKTHALLIDTDGCVYSGDATDLQGVRPAMWVDLDAGIF